MTELPKRVEDELDRLRVENVPPDWPDVRERAETAAPTRPGRRVLWRTLVVAAAASTLLVVPAISGAIGNLLPWHKDARLTLGGSVLDAHGKLLATVEVRSGSRLLIVDSLGGKRVRVFNPTGLGRPASPPTWVWHVHFVDLPVNETVRLRVRGLARPVSITLCRHCHQDAGGFFRNARVATPLLRGRGELVVSGERRGSGKLAVQRGGP